MEGALRVSIDSYDTTWSGHLELEISIVWHRIESSECGSSEQCVIATMEGDDIEDQVFYACWSPRWNPWCILSCLSSVEERDEREK